ncbi:hypothetical protein HK097_006130, partial [Rhizophlyctis rosea]
MTSPHATPPPSSTPSLTQTFHSIRPQQFTTSPLIDTELHKILLLLLRDYISSWYTSISTDPDFLTHLISLLSSIISTLETRLQSIDWVLLLCRDLPEILRRHFHDFRHCKEKLGTAYAGGCERQGLEGLFSGVQPHFALRGGEGTEREYLRRVVEVLMEVVVPEREMRSETVRFLGRE